LEFFLVF
jgi:hypothetical protein